MKQHDPELCEYLVLEIVGVEGSAAFVFESDMPDDLIVVPAPLPSFEADDDTSPLGFTIIGPMIEPRAPAR